ncbi:sugar kinase [Cytophagaceae bacterium DM2B3-1]|uniref:Sugar kinase n=1 Tax=Xanthocytophaga flava TaxID=3048013 RepID=A0ABT7CP99_9BACT|nr:sugar kinase [Xanthocytophaga flavus]MDJ1495570.1 sugar kinase [Xanthocytophaga flavus]
MKKVVTFGEIMMRLSAPLNSRFIQAGHLNITYGGGEANVVGSLAHLGIPVSHVTCFPDNDLGYAAAAFYRKYGVDTKDMVFKGDRLGLYFLEVGASMRASKIVYDRAGSAFANLDPAWFNWEEILKDAQWFHWTGITPAISASAAQACADAIRVARKLGVKVSADVNYRRNLWQYGKTVKEVMPDLIAGCDLIVCAEQDAEDILDIVPDANEANSFFSIASQVMKRFPNIKQIITTRRETLSASYNKLKGISYDQKEYLETPVYDINPIVDRIGGGDAFMAGFIYGTLHYTNGQDALTFAVAASALKHTVEADVNLATVPEIEQIMKGNTSGRLVR